MWIITNDFLHDKDKNLPSKSMKIKSHNFDHDYFYLQDLVKFHLFDDDDELYYEGMMTKIFLEESNNPLAPLDWAMYDSGCTYMMYYENGEWKQL